MDNAKESSPIQTVTLHHYTIWHNHGDSTKVRIFDLVNPETGLCDMCGDYPDEGPIYPVEEA